MELSTEKHKPKIFLLFFLLFSSSPFIYFLSFFPQCHMVLYIFSPCLIITRPWGMKKCSSWFPLYSPQNMGFPERVRPDWWTSTSFWQLCLLAIFWLIGELQYFSGFPLWPYHWTLTWLFPFFYMTSELLKMFMYVYAYCGVFSPCLWLQFSMCSSRTENIPLCISAV